MGRRNGRVTDNSLFFPPNFWLTDIKRGENPSNSLLHTIQQSSHFLLCLIFQSFSTQTASLEEPRKSLPSGHRNHPNPPPRISSSFINLYLRQNLLFFFFFLVSKFSAITRLRRVRFCCKRFFAAWVLCSLRSPFFMTALWCLLGPRPGCCLPSGARRSSACPSPYCGTSKGTPTKGFWSAHRSSFRLGSWADSWHLARWGPWTFSTRTSSSCGTCGRRGAGSPRTSPRLSHGHRGRGTRSSSPSPLCPASARGRGASDGRRAP